jgi:Kef-type K+ transport system membrane component KefB
MALELRKPKTHTIGRLLTLVVIALLAALVQLLGLLPGLPATTMYLGFLLLAAFVAGELAKDLHLPRITGYLVIGILFGPHVLRLVPAETVDDFRLINGIALAVIALQAGGELRYDRVRVRLRSIASITLFQIAMISVGVALTVYVARDIFPFLVGGPMRTVVAAAMIFGLVAVAKSPATTIAVITELRARGPLTDTVLGVSILKDVAILLMIAAVIPAAAVVADPAAGFDFALLREIGIAIVASLAIGAVIGWLMGLYLERVGKGPVLFVLAVAFGIVELSHLLHFESEAYILMSMAAGFFVQNFSVQGSRFVGALEANSLPLYALFFAVAGADLDLGVIPHVWAAGLVLIISRAALIYISTYVGAASAGDAPMIKHNAWMGYLAQAGVTLGLATIVQDRFPSWGAQVAAIIVAMIAVNQLVGPPLFRYSILKAGEEHRA